MFRRERKTSDIFEFPLLFSCCFNHLVKTANIRPQPHHVSGTLNSVIFSPKSARPHWSAAHAMTMETRRPSRGRDSSGHTYQRTYKACLPCRQRKAKCDLPTGPDGISAAPPCAKCRREQRPCVFSEKRAWERTKKRSKSFAICLSDNQTNTSGRVAGRWGSGIITLLPEVVQQYQPDWRRPPSHCRP